MGKFNFLRSFRFEQSAMTEDNSNEGKKTLTLTKNSELYPEKRPSLQCSPNMVPCTTTETAVTLVPSQRKPPEERVTEIAVSDLPCGAVVMPFLGQSISKIRCKSKTFLDNRFLPIVTSLVEEESEDSRLFVSLASRFKAKRLKDLNQCIKWESAQVSTSFISLLLLLNTLI